MNWKYNDLFESLKKDMTPKLVTRIKRRLRGITDIFKTQINYLE